MSNFVVNRNGLDQVTLEMTTTGRNEASINLKDSLLDERLDYVFCVDSFTVPLDTVPINNTLNTVLFEVIRRNVDESLNNALRTNIIAPFADVLYTYTLDRKFFDIASFVRSLNNWARGVERDITTNGLVDFRNYGGPSAAQTAGASIVPPLRALQPRDADEIDQLLTYDMIKFRLGVDGSLVIKMSPDFANSFVLRFSRYGAEVLGVGDKMSAVRYQPMTLNDDGDIELGAFKTEYFLAVTTVAGVQVFTADSWVDDDLLLGPLTIKVGNNVREIAVFSEHSLYVTMDQRVKISLSSHLPMLNNLLVKEQKETVDRMICEVFFTNRITSGITFDEDGIFTEQTLTNTLYAGMYPLIKKSDTNKQWHRLLTSYSLRFFRFTVYVTYRNYDSKKDAWIFDTKALAIKEPKYWNFSIRFISLV